MKVGSQVYFIAKTKVRVVALSAITALVLGQSFIYSQFSAPLKSVASADVMHEDAQTPASIIADAKKELENRKAKNKFVLDDGHQDFYSQYLIGLNTAVDLLNQFDTSVATVDDAQRKVEEAYKQEEEAFNETFHDATETSIAALDAHIRGMRDASTNEKVKAKVDQLSTDLQQKIRSANTLGDQVTITEDMRMTAYQKLGEFEKEVLLDDLEAEYDSLKADGSKNHAELEKVYEAKKAEIQSIVVRSDGTVDKAVDGKPNPTMGNWVTASKESLLKELNKAADTPATTTPAEEEAEQADIENLQRYVADTTYINEDPNDPYPIPYYPKPYRNEYKTLVDEGNKILEKDKKGSSEVKDLNDRFKALLEKLEQSAIDRMGLAAVLLGAPLTDEEGLRDYKPKTWKIYKPVLEKAKEAIDDPDKTEEDLTRIADELQEAVGQLEGVANRDNGFGQQLRAFEGTLTNNPELWTSDTHPQFMETYNRAVAVYNDRDVSQVEIDNMYEELMASYKKVKMRVTKVYNEDAIKKVHHDMGVNGDERTKLDELSRQQYTPESYEPFFRLYDENLALIADTTTSNDEENTARFKAKADELIDAMGKLQKRAKTKDLKDKIAEAEKKLADGNYQDEGVEKLRGLIDEGKKLIENLNASQDDVDQAVTDLQKAIDGLKEKPNTDALKQKVGELKQKDLSGYTDETKAALEDAVKKAEDVLTKDDATQVDVDDALKALEDAERGLKEKTPPASSVDKTALNEAITKAEDALKNNEGKEVPEDLKTALENAKKVAESDDSTQENVVEAADKLNKAVEDFLKTSAGSTVDFTVLDEALKRAEGIDKDSLTDESKTVFEQGVDKAKALREKEGVTQDEVKQAAADLNAIIDELKKKDPVDPQKPNTNALKQKVDELKEKDLSGYTDETKAALEDAVKKAEDVLTKDDATQVDVDDALKALEKAEQGLKEKTAPAPSGEESHKPSDNTNGTVSNGADANSATETNGNATSQDQSRKDNSKSASASVTPGLPKTGAPGQYGYLLALLSGLGIAFTARKLKR